MASIPVISVPSAAENLKKKKIEFVTSASDSDTEGEPIAVQKKCQNTDLVSGDCSATSVADTQLGGRERGEKSSL